jgi:anti-anti-sigma factor
MDHDGRARPVECYVDRTEGVFILKPSGQLDAPGVQELQELTTQLLEEYGARCVSFDLSQAEDLGSVGIRLFMALGKKLTHRGGGLILCSLSDDMKRALGVAGVSRRLSTTDSLEEAVQILAAKERIARLSDEAARLLAAAEEDDSPHEQGAANTNENS